MNKFFFLCLVVLNTIIINANSGKVIISGQVKNHSEKKIAIADVSKKDVITEDLDSEGKFEMLVRLTDGYYLLRYGRYTAYVYLYPNDKLHVTFDANHFETTLKFKGKGEERNNYLANKALNEEKLTKDFESFYKVDQDTYIDNIANVKRSHLSALTKSNAEKFFIKAETKSLEYERLLNIQNYKSNYKFYLGDEITVTQNFYDPITQIDLGDKNDYKKQPYYRYLVNSVWSKRIEEAKGVDKMFKVLTGVATQELAISLVNGFYYKISPKNKKSKDYLNLIKRVTRHQPFIDAAEKRYNEMISAKALNKGDLSPTFSYETASGEVLKLSDLQGKYVYIDIWATWCGPCVKQLPYLKALEQRYHDDNIVFVSISVDKQDSKGVWREMVEDKQLGGVQLLADKSFDSDFMNSYAVHSIPRFILIDPEGKIVDANAPQPSYDKTKILLDSILR